MLIHIETHMYASQWFLTLFTAKFPLPMVYSIMDLFLCHVSQPHARVGGIRGRVLLCHASQGGDFAKCLNPV